MSIGGYHLYHLASPVSSRLSHVSEVSLVSPLSPVSPVFSARANSIFFRHRCYCLHPFYSKPRPVFLYPSGVELSFLSRSLSYTNHFYSKFNSPRKTAVKKIVDNKQSDNLNFSPFWFTGFADAESSFAVNVGKSENNKLG
jgi:hypothetical protein